MIYSPLDELVTYYNKMCYVHLFYFKKFKENNLEILRHIRILELYIPKEYSNNIKEAYELYNSIKDKELTPFEEEAFLKCDEKYFMDDYFLYLIL